MSKKDKPRSRRAQLLALLAEHGPLSVRAIHQMIQPERTQRHLHDSLTRLIKRGLVVNRTGDSRRSGRYFFQLGQTQDAIEQIARMLAVAPDSLIQTHFRSQELEHSEDCAIWTETLRRRLPNAVVEREYRLRSNNEALEVLQTSTSELNLIPDITIRLQNTNQEARWIAIEVERVEKSRSRLYQKLRRMAAGSKLDGVIYLGHDVSVLEVVRSIYIKDVLPKAHRISKYGQSFIVFGTYGPKPTDSANVVRANGKTINLSAWISILCTAELWNRTDGLFEKSA